MSETAAPSVFDTHCHLSYSGLEERSGEVVRRAAGAGVRGILTLGTDTASSARCLQLARELPGVHAAAGVHPNETPELDVDRCMREVARMALQPQTIAVGETGLDLHHRRAPLELQSAWLQRHAELAFGLNLPLVVHSRSAEAECLELLPESPRFPVVMHCYTGPDGEAIRAAERGYWIGFAGPLTFKSNSRLRSLAARLPSDRIVVETDAPFLAPEPVRGGPSEPAMVVHTAKAAAEAMGLEGPRGMERLWSNSTALLGLEEHARTDLLYVLGANLYVNLTGQCDNDCRFCVRKRSAGLGGYHLRHHGRVPEEDRLEKAMELVEPGDFAEVVFCGYGEPTMRPELLRRLAASARTRGGRTRLNTNGLAGGRLSSDALRRMLAPFDSVSVSLNASTPEQYARICRPSRPGAWKRLMDFLSLLREMDADATLTAVAGSGADLRACAALAGRLGFPFRRRGDR